ncbi:hypothetical protein [Streptomyces eurocidicus]|uniref:Uncharacterized protein n=1 Tax=Streptomyces eurocidicus TaxID=66423 RepID=A0A7W8BEX8_STREU|nr:hypothetical protein [Streptomyces eurocidicus]MBB5122085.1 hypothetical protein [Streptomyces eurocidicus]MBF6055417.1 hypothetical protein [Streptomyces eurocidicus]
MTEHPPRRYSPEGTPLGRTADDVRPGNDYSTETPRARRLWWRVRDVLRRPVKNSEQHH